MSYRPICDTWLLARSKVRYYGAYPAGFLQRARDLLGVGPTGSVLHVCSGRVRDYPFKGFGPNDRTIDIDPELQPNYIGDVRDPEFWETFMTLGYAPDACLVDRPYTAEDATHYRLGAGALPELSPLLANCLRVAPRVGVLDYLIPRPPKNARFVACVGVVVGFGNRIRAFTVFERAS